MKEKIVGLYQDHKILLWSVIIFVPLIILILGSLVAREIFWDSFLWKYFWAPVVADAKGKSVNGISAGYNVVNTITYGIVLAISFLGIFELIKHFDIDIDQKMVFSLLPWVILGGSLRSLEDAGLFNNSLDKFMITPIIYFLLGFLIIFTGWIGAYLSRSGWKVSKTNYMRVLILTPLPLLYVLLWNYIDPFFLSFLVVILLFLFLSFLIGIRYLEFNEKYTIFTYGTTLVSISLSYNIYFMLFKEGSNPLEAIIIPLLGVILTSLFLGFFWLTDRIPSNDSKGGFFEILSQPLNVLICWSHLFDASSTYRGITAYGYVEKHVFPGFLIEHTGPEILFVVKVVLILIVIYILDILLEEDFSEDESLRSFLKFVIIVLGAAPAVRNTLRLAMGV